MNKNDLISELNSFNTAERAHRDKSAKFVFDYPETFPFLTELLFENQKRINIKAAWVFELVCFKNILLLVPHLVYFIQNLSKIKNESAIRPIAKVCSFIAKAYYSNSENEIRIKLTHENIQQIVESNFDWLIEDHKVASKVYAMDTLFLFGNEIDWVHEELKLILEKNIATGSAGYQSHAKKVLNKLK